MTGTTREERKMEEAEVPLYGSPVAESKSRNQTIEGGDVMVDEDCCCCCRCRRWLVLLWVRKYNCSTIQPHEAESYARRRQQLQRFYLPRRAVKTKRDKDGRLVEAPFVTPLVPHIKRAFPPLELEENPRRKRFWDELDKGWVKSLIVKN